MLFKKQPKKTMTINLPDKEMAALEDFCKELDFTKTAAVRLAIRSMISHDQRIKAGWGFHWDAPADQKLPVMGCGWAGMD